LRYVYQMKSLLLVVLGLLSARTFAQIDTTIYKTLSDSIFTAGDRILVRDVRFDLSGGGNVQDYSYSILQEVALFLAKNPNMIVEVALFSDLRGHPEHNMTLSNLRAKKVESYLVHRCGVKSNQIIPIGYGSSEPIIPDEVIKAETERHEIERLHQINRRMELRVVAI